MKKQEKQKMKQEKGSGSIKTKIIGTVIPIITILIIAMIVLSYSISSKMIYKNAIGLLDSSIGYQSASIAAWLDKNLASFSMAKRTIEQTKPEDEDLQKIVDAYYGYNSDYPEGLYIADMEGLMAKLKEHHIYTIARVVCFKDPYLAAAKAELALKKPDGTSVTDANGLAFVNPYCEETWEYIVDVAIAASELGFDEIQFDYVRFPIGADADAADYGVDLNTYTKEQAITGFLSYAAERFGEENIVFGADVFGTIIGSETDVERVGQNYRTLGETVDVLSPMVYPSHYANGVFGLDVPDAYPYETVLAALQGSGKELETVGEADRAVVRPWLQSFTATWVDGHIPYEGEEIRQQIQAVYDAGYEEWILWNASNRYSAEGLEAGEPETEQQDKNLENTDASETAYSDKSI